MDKKQFEEKDYAIDNFKSIINEANDTLRNFYAKLNKLSSPRDRYEMYNMECFNLRQYFDCAEPIEYRTEKMDRMYKVRDIYYKLLLFNKDALINKEENNGGIN